MLNNRKLIADSGTEDSTSDSGQFMNLTKFRAAPRADLDSTNQDTILDISSQGTAVASKAHEVCILTFTNMNRKQLTLLQVGLNFQVEIFHLRRIFIVSHLRCIYLDPCF
jgi:hypothetical protein